MESVGRLIGAAVTLLFSFFQRLFGKDGLGSVACTRLLQSRCFGHAQSFEVSSHLMKHQESSEGCKHALASVRDAFCKTGPNTSLQASANLHQS